MIDCLVYTPEAIKAYYHFGIEEVSANQPRETNKVEGQNPLALSFLSVNQTFRRLLAASNLSIGISSDFKVGAVGRTRTCNPLVRSQVLYPLNYDCNR